ncbi:hypothetical protein O8I61_07870, partial [Campylobacter lari]|uniref:hypothetical protein n=1 Tax=Campylobacter lari TaxID=201 RepID=UPI00372A1960
GNISSGYDVSIRQGYNKVTFQGENAKLEGQINLVNGGQNEIHFKKGGTITGLIQTKIDGYGPNFDQKNVWNRITFDGNENASISGKGNVISSSGRANIITFNGTGTNTITGNIFAENSNSAFKGNGNNTITFNSNGTNTINGNIVINSGSNTIIFKTLEPSQMQKDASLEPSQSPNSSKIDGSIQAFGGVNT